MLLPQHPWGGGDRDSLQDPTAQIAGGASRQSFATFSERVRPSHSKLFRIAPSERSLNIFRVLSSWPEEVPIHVHQQLRCRGCPRRPLNSRRFLPMVLWLFKLILCFRQATGEFTPRQLALGTAFGLVLGLVPKGNLIAAAIAIVVLSLRLNLAAATVSTLVFSLLGPLLDPLTHGIGTALLENSRLTGIWTQLYRWPFAPWTAFNNTVVLGSLLVGLAAFLPFYFLTKWAFQMFPSRSYRSAGTPGVGAAGV